MSDTSDAEISGDDSTESSGLLYRDRESWSDVVPVPQDDGPNPIVAIAYTEKFKDAYDYFRAILKCNEKSERALELTAHCINLNPANYTVWQYRREILKELDKDLKDELEYADEMIRDNFKNYQVWHHRMVIVEWLQDPSAELKFTQDILKKESKNYHAWQYRQWVISTFNLYDNELEYVEDLLKEDVRNNSAWNQRYFLINNTTKFLPHIIEREVDFALNKISQIDANESAWSYLRGVLTHDEQGLGYNKKVLDKCQELYNEGLRTNHLLACIVDICQERYPEDNDPDSFFHITRAFELCKVLADKYDKIRKRYWNYISQQLEERVNLTSTD